MLEDPSWFLKAYFPFNAEGRRRRLFVERGLKQLSRHFIFAPAQWRMLKDEDWAHAWKQDYQVQHIGQHLVIVPAWISHSPKPREVIVKVDPGMAFGTGQHATTRLCLEAIEERLKPGQRALDVGTGSGILAIASIRLGASRVIALDTDAVALDSARRNALLNRTKSRIIFCEGALEDLSHRHGKFHLVVANILAVTILSIIPQLRQYLLAGGTFIASGILEEQVQAVKAAFKKEGFRLLTHLRYEGWAALVVEA